jgi:uncharacterized protein (TIGR02145 family)
MRRRNLILLIAVYAAIALLPVTGLNADYVCGDANEDGALNVSDAVFLINHIFIGGPAPDSNCCGEFEFGTVTDMDGNLYFTVKIGNQWWMAENLKVTHYRNGDLIENITEASKWSTVDYGACCIYDNEEVNRETYGVLYNWYAVADKRDIAPEGWHVPTEAELDTLIEYLGGCTVAGGKMKLEGTEYWNPPNVGATNETGFTGLPGGYRSHLGDFFEIGNFGEFWSSTEYNSDQAIAQGLHNASAAIYHGRIDKRFGMNVRCVKDQ